MRCAADHVPRAVVDPTLGNVYVGTAQMRKIEDVWGHLLVEDTWEAIAGAVVIGVATAAGVIRWEAHRFKWGSASGIVHLLEQGG